MRAGIGPCGLAKPGKAVKALEHLFSDKNTEAMLAGKFESQEPFAQKTAKKISFKAPVALRIAHQLMNEALATPIQVGAEMELSSLPEIFATKDARTGLGSVGRTRPVFEGR